LLRKKYLHILKTMFEKNVVLRSLKAVDGEQKQQSCQHSKHETNRHRPRQAWNYTIETPAIIITRSWNIEVYKF